MASEFQKIENKTEQNLETEIELKKREETDGNVVVVAAAAVPYLTIDLVFEVLTRLSIKELFKCMPLSKAWRSAILDHPGFPDAYRRHNPRVLVLSVLSEEDRRCRFYYSSLGDGDEFVLTATISGPNNSDAWFWATQVIDGLVCLYGDSAAVAVHLYNTLTGEVLKLPEPLSPVDDEEDLGFFMDNFSFGFDPVNSEYKLLRMVFRYHDSTSQAYILTLGTDSSWRKLPAANFPIGGDVQISTEGFVVNGVLYWKTRQEYLLSFDLSKEVFLLIPTPDVGIFGLRFYYFAQFRGRLCLFPETFCGNGQKLVIHMLDYNSQSGSFWTRHQICLPRGLRSEGVCRMRAVAVGSLLTGEILLADGDSGCSFTTVYSYNYYEDEESNTEKNIFKRFTIGKLPESIDLLRLNENDVVISSVEPNFGTLHSLIGSRDIR